MEIQDVKSRLSLSQVLNHYNLKPDRNGRICCPFHDDKTPSLQIYTITNTWTCFSSNCTAGSGDQIDFIMRYEKLSKHDAIMKAKLLTGYNPSVNPQTPIADNKHHPDRSEKLPEAQRIQLLTKA